MHTPEPGQLPLPLVDKHIDAIRAIVREDLRGESDATALEVADRLQDLVESFLAEAHAGDAAWLAEHAAPALVPTNAG